MDTRTEQEGIALAHGDSTDTESVDDAEWCRSIALRIGAGDTQAEEKLVARMGPGLQMIVNARCLYDRALAADICQEALIVVLNRLRNRTLEDPARLAAFAAQTARQLAFDAKRRAALRKTTVDSRLVDSAAVEAPVDDSPERASANAFVRRLLEELPHERDREILRRFYLLDHDKSDICSDFGLAPNAFDQLVFRARGQLRKFLERQGIAIRDVLCTFIWVPKSWLN
jgi:RNA polymerase sigma-70 factor (ECF subfamily)